MSTRPTLRAPVGSHAGEAPDAGRRGRLAASLRGGGNSLLLLPGVALLLVVFVYPLAFILWRSFTDPSTGWGNYTKLLHDGVSVPVLLRTLVIGAVVAAVTLVIAYPYAYFMSATSSRARQVLTALVLLPFWTSLIARNFAWYMLLERDGLIERAFGTLGIHGVVLLGSAAGVTIAMVQVMLPYMVLPLYSAMEGIDRNLLRASSSLGAAFHRTFFRIYLPLSMPGVLSGFSLVFILAIGFYVTPALLGSPQQSLVSQLIANRVNTLLDFGGAGAFGAVLLVITLILLAAIGRSGAGRASVERIGR